MHVWLYQVLGSLLRDYYFLSKKLIFSEDIHLEEFYSKYYNQKFLNIENCVLQLGLYIMIAIENKKVASKKKRKRNHSRKYLVS